MFSEVWNIFWDGVMSLLAAVLPASSGLPSFITNAISTLLGYMYAFSYIIPVNTLISAIIIAISFEAGILTFRAFRFIINLLRGSGA